ncbi:Flp family type IVb pilin [Nocardioides sp. DS6]|uniref:Flp family type IVb pilin n=1 Tax=Nocardioides eburneus TaxID=3231482 RepID=A0ABV3SWW2_9ACTN
MHSFIASLRNIFTMRRNEERGASAVEYGLLVAGIALVVIAGVFFFGGKITNMFHNSADTVCSTTQGDVTSTVNCDTPTD